MDMAGGAGQALRRGWLADQSAAFQQAVLRSARLVDRPAGDVVVGFGDHPGGIYGIAEGAIGIHVPSPEGHAVLASITRAGTWFGQTPLFSGRPSTLAFSVIEPARLLFLPKARAQEIAALQPDFLHPLYALAGHGAENSIANLGSLLVRNPARRIAASLLRIAPDPDASGAAALVITQDQLGEIANAARDVVNRTLKAFEGRGWVAVGYRRITILKPDLMARFVETGA